MSNDASQDLKQIISSAERLGIEMDEAEAIQWLTQMAADQSDDIVIDEESGVFGHKAVMLDFSSAELEHFRKVGGLVEFGDEPGVVETALALSGSAAQSKIQTYPGDADFFERVNIKAETRDEACRILGNFTVEGDAVIGLPIPGRKRWSNPECRRIADLVA